MKSDRELLELAAKAAGIGGGWGEVHVMPQGEIDCTDLWFLDGGDHPYAWNPLTDDGDALRLAVKLNMILSIQAYASTVFCEMFCRVFQEMCLHEIHGKDGATRRAIVRAAAAIAEQEGRA